MSASGDDHYVPSEAERDAAQVALRSAAVDGRLGLEEYLRAADSVAVAQTRAELVAVTAGLEAAVPPAAATRLRRRWWVPFGNRVYRGRFVLPERTRILIGMGEVHLDLRGATLVGPSPTLRLTVLVGTLRLLVPPGVTVEIDQSSYYGGRNLRRFGGEPLPTRPLIRVRMRHMMGNVHVTDDPARWSPVVVPASEPPSTWTPRPLPPEATGEKRPGAPGGG